VSRIAIFDWYGTLARWEHEGSSHYVQILNSHGYEVDPLIIDSYFNRWDGTDHVEHSRSRETYVAWTRSRLVGLLRDCGVGRAEIDAIAEDLLDADLRMPMVAFPESATVLTRLRQMGVTIGVCSNWGWDLEPFLDLTNLRTLIDVAITSARVGYRKPHPSIYAAILKELDAAATDAVFIGDSWAPDVLGPISAGMAAVHVCRDPDGCYPDLVGGAFRVTGLEELLTLSPFSKSP
jgi:putative hydrolase of the HAD superfamily